MEARANFFQVFLRRFFRTRFGIDFGWIFGGPKPEKQQFSLGKTMIFTKSTFSKKVQKDIDFGVVFGSRNDEKSRKIGVQKHMFFCYRFLTFFFDFLRFWLDFGRPWAFQKLAKNRKNRIRDAFGMRFGFFIDFGAVLAEFGWILNGFWADF